MPDPAHIEPPISEATTLRELNIHMGFIREKMNSNNEERKVDMAEIKGRLKDLAEHQVTRLEFDDLKKDVISHQVSIDSLIGFRDTLTGKIWGISTAVGAGVTVASFILNHFVN